MFYLLENNKIVDSNTGKCLNLHYEVKERYLERYLMRYDNDKFFETKNLGIIKKQSENVFDLIENGDLLKYKDRFDKKVYVEIVKEVIVELGLIRTTTNVIKYGEMVSFYKPNSNGDYIKVWEEKYENY